MNDTLLGGLIVALMGAVGYLFWTGQNQQQQPAYDPYAYGAPGQVQPQAAPPPQGQAPAAQPAPQPATAPKPVEQKQKAKEGEPKKPNNPKAPTAPNPQVLQTQNLAQLQSLINSFGRPIGPDQERGCYVSVKQFVTASAVNELATVNERCNVTPYANGSYVLTRQNGEPFFKFFGGPISLIRVDPGWPDINFFEPRAPGFNFDYSWGTGPGANCVSADDGANIQVMVCTPPA